MNVPPSMARCCRSCLETCDAVEPTVQLIEAVGKVAPEYAEEAQQLRDARDHLKALASTILNFAPAQPGA